MSASPRRILSLDGGGVRGIVSVAFLEKLEAEIRLSTNNQDLVLADHFHLIGGTSVGAMIAAMLALGWEMSKVSEVFRTSVSRIFRRETGGGFFAPKFSARGIEEVLRRELGDMKLGDARIKTGLAIITKRLDTGAPWWIVTNNANGRFWDNDQHFEVASLIRASTAAPTVFEPKTLPLAKGGPEGLFVDGGLSPFNNPSLALLMTAVLKPHGFCWPLGVSTLQMISIGTGSWRERLKVGRWHGLVTALFGVDALRGMINDNQALSLALMQWMSEPRLPQHVNSEAETLRGELLSTSDQPLLRYQRYDLQLEKEALAPLLPSGKAPGTMKLKSLRSLDNPAEMKTLYELAKKVAGRDVSAADCP